jgi:hypothetical protein
LTRDIRLFVVGADFAATFAPSKTGGPELSRRLPLSLSDHSRTCTGTGPFSTLQHFLSLARCRIAQRVLRRILPLEVEGIL